MATTLVLKGKQKNGGARYGLPGMRTSAYFPPTMFVSDPPEQIVVDEPGEPATGPDGQPLTNPETGEPVIRGSVFATEAKRLREDSKRVLKEARERIKAARKGGGSSAGQPSLVDEGATV